VFRHVIVHRNSTEKPADHIRKYSYKITGGFGVTVCGSTITLCFVCVFVCVFHCIDTLWWGYFDFVGRMLQF
jgi:hypothetical protein